MNIKKIYLNIICCFLAFGATAQTLPFSTIENATDNSPYSRFGLGDLAEPYFSHLYHMGALGAAYQDKYHLNIVNPASIASLKATSFEMGLYAEYSELSEGDNTFTSWNGNLSSLALAFPLANPVNDLLDRIERNYDLGMSFSLTPYSSIGYDIQSENNEGQVPGINSRYVGNGGTYNLQWSNAIKVKDFSAGLSLGYIFGSIGQDKGVRLDSLINPFHNLETINSHVTGFSYNLGVQYDISLNDKEIEEDKSIPRKHLTLGLYGGTATNFSTTNDVLFLAVRDNGFSQGIILDTISNIVDQEGKGKLPGRLGVGAMYSNGEKWGVGFNYELQNWSVYENDIIPARLNNSYKLSVGGFYRPDPLSITNYFKRLHYQFGAFYKKEPIVVNEQEINSAGLTLGIGLPFINQRRVSNANIGATFATRGIGTTIEEKYIRLNFGFTFNSTEWFIKRKYN